MSVLDSAAPRGRASPLLSRSCSPMQTAAIAQSARETRQASVGGPPRGVHLSAIARGSVRAKVQQHKGLSTGQDHESTGARLLPSQLGWHACFVWQSAASRRYYRSRFLGFWRVRRHALHGASTTVVARPRMNEAGAGRNRRPPGWLSHAPQRIRTSNLRFRRPMLYPVELGALAVLSAGKLPVAVPLPANARNWIRTSTGY
jgi:hypothetical protein